MTLTTTKLGLFTLALVFIGCSHGETHQTTEAATEAATAPVTHPAVAKLERKSGDKKLVGSVQFLPTSEGVKVVAEISGLKPGSTHGFHIHETGDCSAPDAKSAGGHFNPAKTPHGAPTDMQHHMGDMGNIQADKTGSVKFERLFPLMSLDAGNANNVIGKAVVVHGKADNLKSQPAGDAGSRIGCGVITSSM
jgi:Cu-Zn family superoxide dismutase